MPEVRVPGFLPSRNGLHFTNYYPHEPAISVPLPTGGNLGIGDAANGLCGGMVFAVRDYFEANRLPPADAEPPAAGTPLYRYLVRRLIDSFNLPLGIARYFELMAPAFPDVGLAPGLPGRASVMLNTEWPRIRADIDAGHPVPLGLIKVKSAHVNDVGKNHQVLAYGYDLNGPALALWLYDPNYPDRDDVQLSLSLADPQKPVSLTYSVMQPVLCFFTTPYAPARPPLEP